MTLPVLPPPCEMAAAQVAPETPGCASHAKKWVLGAAVLASSVVFLEATVINVALPAIQQTFAAPVTTMQWIANTYTLALASLTLVGGALGDRRGRRRVLIAGLCLFTVATLATGLAPNGIALIAGRMLQGTGAALVAPNSLAMLSAAFPRNERGRALGVWSAAAALTGGAAPLFGGWLVDAVSWRAVFLLGVPPALIALALVATRVPESRAPGVSTPLDLAGAGLAALAFATLTAGLIAAAGRGGSAAIALLLSGVSLLLAFLWVESHRAAPMMPPALFRSRAFSAANLVTLLVYFATSAAFFLLPFALVQGYGYSAALTGAVFLPFAAAMGLLSRWSGGLVERWGARRPLVLGPALTGLGLLLFAQPLGDGGYWTTFFPPMALIGIGMAITAPPLTAVVMGAVDVGQAGVASGVNNTVARVAALLAVAVAGAVALEVFGGAVRTRVDALDVAPAVRAAVIGAQRDLGDARVPDAAGDAAPALAGALRAALVDAFRAVALLAAGLAAAGALCAAIGIEPAVLAAPEAAASTCEHLVGVVPAAPLSDGCEGCRRIGHTWIHLRLCLACGHVGCCDASAPQHALRHFRATGHPVIQSLAAGESWRWCYLDETIV